MPDSIALSHPRSVSRASGADTSISRSLIKKHIESEDLNAADLLLERFTSWKIIVKQLCSYFEGIADVENSHGRELTKMAGFIQVPFRSGNQFLGTGGLQDIFFSIRDKARQMADQHADLGRTVNSSIVQHLQKLLVEIKAHLKNIQNDTATFALSVAKERDTSTKLIGSLTNDVSMARNTPMSLTAKSDPYIANKLVLNQLQKQVLEENLLQKSIITMQQNSGHFEIGIVRAIQSAWQTFDEWQSRTSSSTQDAYRAISAHMASLTPDKEWISFAARSDHLIDPETPLRDPAHIHYPCKDDPTVVPVCTGYLERKKRFSRTYEESYTVLSSTGFLHAFTSSDPSSPSGQGLNPVFSIFLPNCTLGPPSAPSAKAHRFHIEGRKDGTGTTKSGSIRALLHADSTVAWTFRARSREQMMEWWNAIRQLCARYLVASEQIERNGPVQAAVRSAGYEEVDDEYDSGEGIDNDGPNGETTYVKGDYHDVEMSSHGFVKSIEPTVDTHAHNARHSSHQEKQPEAVEYIRYETDGDGEAVGQDTIQLGRRASGVSHDTSPPYQVKVLHSSGYVPENLHLSSEYVDAYEPQDHVPPRNTTGHRAQVIRSSSPLRRHEATPSPNLGQKYTSRDTEGLPPPVNQSSVDADGPTPTRKYTDVNGIGPPLGEDYVREL